MIGRGHLEAAVTAMYDAAQDRQQHLKANQLIARNILPGLPTFRTFPFQVDVFARPHFLSGGRFGLTRASDDYLF